MIINGIDMDGQSRCIHYSNQNDFIAIKFKCCDKYFCCYKCHDDICKLKRERFNINNSNKANIICGICKTTFSIVEYINSSECPACSRKYNERCSIHYEEYFDLK